MSSSAKRADREGTARNVKAVISSASTLGTVCTSSHAFMILSPIYNPSFTALQQNFLHLQFPQYLLPREKWHIIQLITIVKRGYSLLV